MIARLLQWALNGLMKRLERVMDHVEDVWDDEDEDWHPKLVRRNK